MWFAQKVSESILSSDDEESASHTMSLSSTDNDDEEETVEIPIQQWIGKAVNFGSRFFDKANEKVLKGRLAEILAHPSPTHKIGNRSNGIDTNHAQLSLSLRAGHGAPHHRDGILRRLPVIAVLGSETCEYIDLSDPLGSALASHGFNLLIASNTGAPASVAASFSSSRSRQGSCLGLFTHTPESAFGEVDDQIPDFVEFPLRTYLSPLSNLASVAEYHHSKDHLVALTADVIIALPGDGHVAVQVMMARRIGRPVVMFLGADDSPEDVIEACPGLHLARTLHEVLDFIHSSLLAIKDTKPQDELHGSIGDHGRLSTSVVAEPSSSSSCSNNTNKNLAKQPGKGSTSAKNNLLQDASTQTDAVLLEILLQERKLLTLIQDLDSGSNRVTDMVPKAVFNHSSHLAPLSSSSISSSTYAEVSNDEAFDDEYEILTL